MKKYPLIGISIVAVIVLILASLSNAVGFQTVQLSNQQKIKEKINQKELLFQTILDMANNKEIQWIVSEKQGRTAGLFAPSWKMSFRTPVLTKTQINRMYLVGVVLTKVMNKARIHSMIRTHQLVTPGLQQEINAVIEKDATIKEELTQLSSLKCDCGNNSENAIWSFPILCTILFPLVILALSFYFAGLTFLGEILGAVMGSIGGLFNCWWH